jgi:hypothetical protein
MDGWFVGRGGGLLSPRLRDHPQILRCGNGDIVPFFWGGVDIHMVPLGVHEGDVLQ